MVLLYGFAAIIAVGTILLMLPISSQSGKSMGFVNALFMATSGVSTTGLVVVDPGSFLSLFGQIVLILLTQVGGLGYMVFVVLIVYAIREKPSLGTGLALQESLAGAPPAGMRGFARKVLLVTFIFESVGAAILASFWIKQFPVGQSIWLGVFHSISAFCTAGFSLFPNSLSSYQGSPLINVVIYVLCIAGGIGFFVISDLGYQLAKAVRGVRPRPLSIHSKLAIITSVFLMLAGTGIIFAFDTRSMSVPLGKQLWGAAFQSISASTTTGLTTIDIGAMSSTSLFVIIILMFIGSSPGGTGGGIKTTTFALMICSLLALFRGKNHVDIFWRRVPQDRVDKAFLTGLMAISLVCLGAFILTVTEDSSFLSTLFEVTSAFGNTGLSTGITPGLSILGKLTITVIMLIGRVGPLAVGLSLFGGPKPIIPTAKYADGEVFVG